MLPRVGVADDGAFVCDLRGTERLLGTPIRVARNAVSACGASGGALISGGLGTTPFVARVAASRTTAGAVTEIPAGDEHAFLDPLPLDVLPLDPKVVEELGLLGVRRIGEFLALPRGSAAGELAEGVKHDGLAALRILLVLEREELLPLRLERSLLPPSGESAAIVRSLRWGLEEITTLGLVTAATLEITAVEPARGRQIGLFAPDGAYAEEAIAVAQFLRTKLGPATVLQPRVVDAEARLPERAAEWGEVVR